jgi:hypothetical protein
MPDSLRLSKAYEWRKVNVSLRLRLGLRRTGILNGSVQLLGYETAGKSRRRFPNWLFVKTDEVIDLQLLDQTFPGACPTATGNYIRWDKLFIRGRLYGRT